MSCALRDIVTREPLVHMRCATQSLLDWDAVGWRLGVPTNGMYGVRSGDNLILSSLCVYAVTVDLQRHLDPGRCRTSI